MDQSVKRMLKLIEEDGDSFAKKAEMYYQKRPELIAHVEEFYRIYRSLAERYDHVTGELRKNIPSDLQSQGSGISDVGSEQTSMRQSSDQRKARLKSGPRAAGFEFFLGTGGSSSDLGDKGDESSTFDSETESDDSSLNNYSSQSVNGDDQGLRRKFIKLEAELRDVKEKLHVLQEESAHGSFKGNLTGNSDGLLAKIAGYEEALRDAKVQNQLAEEEIARLKILQKELHKSQDDVQVSVTGFEIEENQSAELEEVNDRLEDASNPEQRIKVLEKELSTAKEKIHASEKEVASLMHQVECDKSSIQELHDSAKKDTSMWKVKIDKEKREVSKLQDRILRYKANLSERDQEIRSLKETIANANKSLSEENSQLQVEMKKLMKERAYLEDDLKEWDLRCQSVEEELRRVQTGKAEIVTKYRAELEQLKAGIAERDDLVEELNRSLDKLALKYDKVTTETHDLNIKVADLETEVRLKDDNIDQMGKHLHELRIEHVELIGGTERAHKMLEGLRSRVKELEEEIERKQKEIMEGAEEKREAIRQLCFSLEHYRNGYLRLRQAFVRQRRFPVAAS